MISRLPFRYFRSVFRGRKNEWSARDFKETQEIHDEVMNHRTYQKINYTWKHGLELKQKYRERRKEREEKILPGASDSPKLVVHSFEPVETIQKPRDDQIFAVVNINGFQHKVTHDDLIITDKLPYDIGNRIEFDSVLIVGTPSYTLIGRPFVTSSRVIASVEEQTLSEKTHVFKMKRRKRYKRFYGHRQQITVLRIEKIEHETGQHASLFLPITGYNN